MKKVISLLLLALSASLVAQRTVLFQENFDLPSGPDSVTVSTSAGTSPVLWNDTSLLSVSPTQSFHLLGAPNATVSFETQAFSTIGADRVFLTFDHIAKIADLNTCKIYISVNNGNTWLQANSFRYLGGSLGRSGGFASNSYFNDETYAQISTGDVWNHGVWTGPGSVPNNNWWVRETFEFTPLTSSGGGWAQVKIRFEGAFTAPPAGQSSFSNGWFVDNVEIVSSPCDNYPPDIGLRKNYFTTPPYCRDSLLTGAYTSPTTFNQLRDVQVIDLTGIDSVYLVEIVNGVPRPTVPVTMVPNGLYRLYFTNYAAADTVQWAVEAYDDCGNLGRFPKVGYHTFFFQDSVAKCANGDCGQGHGFVKQFPWKEDFEGPEWVPGTGLFTSRGSTPKREFYELDPPINQNYGWSVYSGVSNSPVTGTVGDHTTGTGNYLYTNFLGQSLVASSTFTLPCIDLRDSVSRTLSFYYHMHGADIDRLKIDIDTTKGTVEVWEPYLKLIGEQQTSKVQPWKKATVSLEPFRGKIVKLRFFGKTNAGTSAWDNIAIDDIEIADAPPTDVALVEVVSPNLSPCAPTTGINVEAVVYNKGFTDLPSVPFAYQLGSGAVIRDTLVTNGFALNDTLNFSFAQALSYNANLPHVLKVWTELPGDTDQAEDTLVLNLPVQADRAINSFPYVMDFEKAKGAGANSRLNTGQWTLEAAPQNATYWAVDSGHYSNSLFGATTGLGKKGKSISTRTASSFTGVENALLKSGCIDLTGMSNPELTFQYFAISATALKVRVRETGQSWNTFSVPASPTSKTKLRGHRISLAAYAGKSVEVTFEAESGIDYSVVLDDITLKERPTIDLALTNVDLTRFIENRTVYSAPRTHFTNWGQGSVSGNYYSTLKVLLVNKCNAAAAPIYGETDSLLIVTSSFPLNGNQVFANLTFAQAVPTGEYLAKYWLESTGDQFSGNDTAYVAVVCQEVVAPPYFNDFEACATGVFTDGPNNQWEVAAPQKPAFSAAHSGSKCAITNADTNMQVPSGSVVEIMELPGFAGFDTLHGLELRLWQNFDFGNDYGVVQIFDGTTYQTLYNPMIAGNNWGSLLKPLGAPYGYGFKGSSSGWVYSTYPLAAYRAAGPNYIRFITTASGVPGWAIDDVEIYVPPQNSGSPVFLSFNNNLPVNGTNPVSLKIENSGAAPLTEVEVFVESNGTAIHQETITFGSPLLSGSNRTVALSQPLNLNSGMSELLIRTALPNHRADVLPQDDTLRVPIYFLAEVDSVPQCFDFENEGAFLAFDLKSKGFDTTWTYGTPSKVLLNSAHTGTNAWFTQGASYARLLNQYLFTPIYEVNDNTCYRLSFWQNFDTERNFDGGNVEFSLDSGATWKTLGIYWSWDSLWYNIPYVQSLDQKPGFSGSSGGWSLAQNDFKVFGNPIGIQFRFRFASDADISGEGWAIDDVCLEAIGTNCQTIGLEPEELVNTNAYLYPVPSSSTLNLRADLNGIHHLSIYDQRGAVVRKWNEELNPTEPSSITIEKLPAGVYWLQIENTPEPVILKFIKD